MHGEGLLHHLALPAAGREIARVLKTGGRAVFKDPLGQNPVLELARDFDNLVARRCPPLERLCQYVVTSATK
jgi:SAM-dependent methyltransferase